MMELLEAFCRETCACGKPHTAAVDKIIVEKGAIQRLPQCIRVYNAKKVFVLADVNTNAAAGETVCTLLEKEHIPFVRYVFPDTAIEPDEKAVGSAIMHYDSTCDLVIGVGSGVIHDIGKMVSSTAGKPYFIVATAPSMDGYASATSSMNRDGLKVSIPTKCAEVIIGDIDVLRMAPTKMLQSGLGDMLAKYISICEWRIAHLITGEYYCERVADLVRSALRRCVENAEGLLARDERAVAAVFEGLVIGGIAMAYAGASRPASGVEHYFSHVWDMRGLEFGTSVDTHGIQCAVGTLAAAKLYAQVKQIKPDREKAIAHVHSFDYAAWSRQRKAFLGRGADAMEALEKKEQKYSVEKHAERIEIILENWERILEIIEEEIPSVAELEALLDKIDAPKTPADIGIERDILPLSFAATRDIRDKYVLSRLVWDLGISDRLSF